MVGIESLLLSQGSLWAISEIRITTLLPDNLRNTFEACLYSD